MTRAGDIGITNRACRRVRLSPSRFRRGQQDGLVICTGSDGGPLRRIRGGCGAGPAGLHQWFGGEVALTHSALSRSQVMRAQAWLTWLPRRS